MSTTLKPHAPSSKGAIVYDRKGYILLAAGDTVPTDGAAGYTKGCFFVQTDGSAGTHWYLNEGTPSSCDFNAALPPIGSLAALTATLAELNRLDDDNAVLSTTAGAGITGGTGTIYKNSVRQIGTLIHTTIYIDLTGLASSTTDLDIIGVGSSAAHIGQITAARNGTIEAIRMTCLELPAGGADDIDLYAATEGTGIFDGGVAALTETALITAGGAWANGTVKGSTAVPAADQYLYLTGGEGGTAATYTAGKFLIELFGY